MKFGRKTVGAPSSFGSVWSFLQRAFWLTVSPFGLKDGRARPGRALVAQESPRGQCARGLLLVQEDCDLDERTM